MAPIAPKKVPTVTGDYTILPLQITPVPSYPTATTHYLYIRPHEPKLPDAKSPRSLFVVNVPIDATDVHMRSLFSIQLAGGLVEDVTFDTTRPSKSAMVKQAPAQASKKRKRVDDEELVMNLPPAWDREVQRSGSSAVVVFVDKASMDAALKSVKKAAKARTELVWGEGVEDKMEKLGSSRYRAHHDLRFPSKDDLQAAVDTYMATFAAAEASRSRSLTRQRAVPDADGFITVTRGGRVGPARNDEAQEKAEELRKKEEEKRAGMKGFYRFQVREQNKQRAGELVKRFQEDRRRVDEGNGKANRYRKS